MTVAVAVTVPPLPVAVRVYFVVAEGVTVADPDAATVPTPLSMETAVAFVVVQVSVAELPAVIVVTDAERLAVGGAAVVCTVTVATEVAVPPLPVAVNVYCVVAEGLTVIDPDAATVPTPLSMETVAAFVVVHVSVAELPAVIVVGDAERLAVGGGGAGCTVTVATEVAVPPLPVAVNVYCVVADGLTFTDPEAATVPTPLSIETLVAFVVVHVRVAELPAVTLAGVAEREAAGVATTGADVDELLPQPDRSPIQTHAAIIDTYFFDRHMFKSPRTFTKPQQFSTVCIA